MAAPAVQRRALLVVIYHRLRRGTPYKDLGADHFRKLDPKRQTKYHVKKLEELGHKVTLVKEAA